MWISIYYLYFYIYAKTHLGDPLGLSGLRNANDEFSIGKLFQHEYPPMIHESRLQLDSHRDLFPLIEQDLLVRGHRSRRGSHTERGIRSSSGRRRHNDCPTS